MLGLVENCDCLIDMNPVGALYEIQTFNTVEVFRNKYGVQLRQTLATYFNSFYKDDIESWRQRFGRSYSVCYE